MLENPTVKDLLTILRTIFIDHMSGAVDSRKYQSAEREKTAVDILPVGRVYHLSVFVFRSISFVVENVVSWPTDLPGNGVDADPVADEIYVSLTDRKNEHE